MRDRFNERYIAAIKADCMHECCLESGFVKLSKADTFIEYCFEMHAPYEPGIGCTYRVEIPQRPVL